VHGAALAGGMGLAANCHIVVAADHATLGLTEIRIGLSGKRLYNAASGLTEAPATTTLKASWM
jgi:enoyl-CoA hydratase/carnithine racemase